MVACPAMLTGFTLRATLGFQMTASDTDLVFRRKAARRLADSAFCPKCNNHTVQRVVRRGLRQCISCYVFYLKHTKNVARGKGYAAKGEGLAV